MNKKEKFLTIITALTKEKNISWTIGAKKSHFDLIADASKITRAFNSIVNDKTIVVTEKKYPNFVADLEDYYDKSVIDVYVISNGLISTKINHLNASIDLLIKLINVVSDSADDIDDLIEELEK